MLKTVHKTGRHMLEDIIKNMRDNNLKILVFNNTKPVELLYAFNNHNKKIVLKESLHVRLETMAELSHIDQAYEKSNNEILITPPSKENIIEISIL